MDEDYEERLRDFDAILVPGGFGKRGVAGMIRAITYARKSRTPYFGICLGMQTATIEYARSVCGLVGADSTEFDPETPYPVIFKLRDLIGVEEMGGTMRLGEYPCNLAPGSLAREVYGGSESIGERHRHRYEFNSNYRARLAEHGFVCSGTSPDRRLVEFIELADHPYWVATQAHPEFKSRPERPHPLFRDLIGAALTFRENRLRSEISAGQPEPATAP
jgi:CTP synthase